MIRTRIRIISTMISKLTVMTRMRVCQMRYRRWALAVSHQERSSLSQLRVCHYSAVRCWLHGPEAPIEIKLLRRHDR